MRSDEVKAAQLVRVRVLGPLTVEADDKEVTLGPQQRVLLAALLVAGGRPVGKDQLTDLLWRGADPADADATLRSHILHLRRTLEPDRRARLGFRVLVSVGGRNSTGYAVRLAEQQLDAAHFVRLLDDARRASAEGDPQAVLEWLDQALGLWRGSAFGDLSQHDFVTAEARRLDELRIKAEEDRVEALLALGRYDEVIADLAEPSGERRLREKVWFQLIIALYHSGRKAEALATYRNVYELFKEELGIEPGGALRELHQQILKSDPVLDSSPRMHIAVVPRQLPPDVTSFTGREGYLRKLDELLPGTQTRSQWSPVGVISGVAGVGKTALAVHWMHRVSSGFPDGQLFLNLRGYAQSDPLSAGEALSYLLRALGVAPALIPVRLDEKEALYRSLIAGKRMLVLLDNAIGLEQIRPLLPGAPTCLMLVTSRHDQRWLTAFHDAWHIDLTALPQDEAVTLFRRMLGQDRVHAEPAAAADLVRLCGGLPLAVRIVAANMAGDRHRTIADMAADLAEGGLLSKLNVAGDQQTAIRSAFDLSYDALAAPVRRLFRLVSAGPGADFTPPAAAALSGLPEPEVDRMLAQLVSRHMIENHQAARFHLHDLVRLYGRERAEQEDGPDELAATGRRLLDWYLFTTDNAARSLYGQFYSGFGARDEGSPAAERADPLRFTGREDALAWLRAERRNLVAAINHSAEQGPHAFAWQVTTALRGYLMSDADRTEWLATARAGLSAAQRQQSRYGRATMHESLGNVFWELGDYTEAILHSEAAVSLYEEIEEPARMGDTLLILGVVSREQGLLDLAREHLTRALTVFRSIDKRAGEGLALAMMGIVHVDLGQLDKACQYLAECEPLAGASESRLTAIAFLWGRGMAGRIMGRLPEARAHLTDSLRLCHQSQFSYFQEAILCELALVCRDAGDLRLALTYAENAQQLASSTGHRAFMADVLNTLGSVLRCGNDLPGALDHHRRALRLAGEIGCRRAEIAAQLGLAVVLRDSGQGRRAMSHARAALTLSRQAGYQGLADQVLAQFEAAG